MSRRFLRGSDADGRATLRIAALFGLLALAWAAGLAALHLTGRPSPLDAIEAYLFDLRLLSAGAPPRPQNVVVVTIDDQTLAERDAGYPLPRRQLAEIVEAIVAGGPKVLALDILLADPGRADSNAVLAASLTHIPSVIAVAGSFDSPGRDGGLPRSASELWPRPVFADASSVGMVNLVTDLTGTPRHVPLLYATSDGVRPALALRAAALFLGESPQFGSDMLRFGTRAMPLDFGFQMPLRLPGPGARAPTLSARDVLSGRSAGALAGKAVVLGYTATAVGDRFETPFETDMPGVEVIASAVAQLIGETRLQRTVAIRRVDAAAAAVLAVLAAGAVWLLAPGLALAAVTALLGAWLAVVWLAFSSGYWLSAALPLGAALPPAAAAFLARYVRDRRASGRTDRAARALGSFHSPVLARRIADDPGFLRRPVTRRLVVFFIDITGFTGLGRELGAEATRDLLKRFHTLIAQEIEDRHGVVLNYMGDGAMAVFGLEGTEPAPADDALRASSEMARILPDAISRGLTDQRPGVRIGLHMAEVVLSRLGHEHHQQVTVTGDGVNLASRLMEVAKDQGAAIATTEEFVSALRAPPDPPPDDRRSVAIRGFDDPVAVVLWRG